MGRVRSAVSLVLALVIGFPLGACATVHGPREIGSWELDASESDWPRVGELAPGAEIFLTSRESPAGRRYFVAADDSGLTVVNVSDAGLSARAAHVVRDLIARQPGDFEVMTPGRFLQQDDVRVGVEGLFVGSRKVADLDTLVHTIGRRDVLLIEGPVIARGSVLGTVLGGWLGFALGVVPGLGGASPEVAWSVLIGSVALGASSGFHTTGHVVDGVVYRATRWP